MFTFIYKNLKSLILSIALMFSLYSFSNSYELESESINTNEKTAIVTGSNRGMGLGWVQHFLSEGYTVVATARKPEKATELQNLKKKYKGKLFIQKLDVTSEEDQAALGEMLKKKNLKIDIAISNAGVTVQEDFGNWTVKGFEINFKVNTIGVALFAQTIAPYLKNGATLVNLSSGAGSITYQKKSSPLDAYRVSKAGVNMLTRNLSARLEDKQIIVVSITPGGVKTDMNPNGKLSVSEAIPIMYESISKLTMENSGTFINNKGKVMAW
ncbi:SDR family NAD(P)-dependent oxidoreductase [Seonamhaeicola maritimus]|uniref:SDR family NAD(P)-dependent oxidoreductase n=1 Tax=Seonamhaeicola maritimus TaxID=2591822 RepID=UPI0024944706|nr:SDR family NAD(P)-dependent oxidoreductase [Seonamhaeicola maritimus]